MEERKACRGSVTSRSLDVLFGVRMRARRPSSVRRAPSGVEKCGR